MFTARLKQLREEKGINKRQFATLLNLPYSTYNNYEIGSREPNSDILIQLAKFFSVPIDYLLGITDDKNAPDPNFQISYAEQEHIQKYRRLDAHGKEMVDTVLNKEIERIRAEATRLLQQTAKQRSKVSYYDVSVSAGTGQPLDYSTLSTITIEGEIPDKASFVVKVSGDSMTPVFEDGDYVYVANKQLPKQGDICIVWHEGNAYIKKLGKEGLISLNTAYPVIKANKDTYILGVVIGKVTGEIEF